MEEAEAAVAVEAAAVTVVAAVDQAASAVAVAARRAVVPAGAANKPILKPKGARFISSPSYFHVEFAYEVL